MSALVPCSGCNRHVKSDETICPFCQAPVTPAASESCAGRCARPSPSRLAGAALVAAGAAALLGAACESSQSAFPPYGISPTFDAGTQAHPDAGEPSDGPDSGDAKK